MLQNYDNFHSVNGKRQILIAEDEMINREILGEMLRNDYELLFACDGRETMEMIREHRETLSLVLLDILMPVMSGLEVLKAVREDDRLSRIPIIVTTAERETEIESLQLGAIDFIPKPYPSIGVIQARVQRTIELSEDRDLIQSTEKDPLTGLYNREYFYRYAEQYDHYHQDQEMDAVIIDINHFHMINERYGKGVGDDVLRRLGAQVRQIAEESGGIACRREADTFMLYCPRREDYSDVQNRASVTMTERDETASRIHLRMGVYADVDKTVDVELRFDRAKMAADTVRGSFTRSIGYYDSALHERELYAEQLIEEFPGAIENRQFEIYYQPKFDVRPETPVLSSAEALVRWIHPELGMISPGVFIPLFEENGLIQKLDFYVWRETARQIREWKDIYEFSIPVSVNVSRIDMYDPALPDTMEGILKEFGISGSDMLLEVTESAYTQDSRQIIETVEKLRALGFHVEMDDFGTGYSSLNMISELPIDALKLDMSFIRDAFREGGNTHMLEVIIGIADYLEVPVIAEGVETEEQLDALRTLGCDIVQGYFFSRPVPAAEFEPFILQKKEVDKAIERKIIEPAGAQRQQDNREKLMAAQMKAIQDKKQEESPETEETGTAEAIPDHPAYSGLHLRTANIFFVVIAFLAALALMAADLSVARGYQHMEAASDRYIAAQQAASDLESGSDYLTDRVRCFVVTGEMEYLQDFFEEVDVTRRRDQAVEKLEKLVSDEESSALVSLNTALELSNELINTEYLAMRLMLEAGNYDMSRVPSEIADITLSPDIQSRPSEELKNMAQTLVFDNNYMHYKDRIRENVSLCTQELIHSASRELEKASAQLALLVWIQTVLTVMFLLIVVGIVLVISRLIRKPLSEMVKKMQAQEVIPPTGVQELRFVTRTYNKILLENQDARERLSHEASHDALTGLFNRGAYDLLMSSTDKEHMALLLIDVDNFKGVNDTYGHAVGDRVLKRVADILKHSFRSVDILCRIGGDEFAVVMTRANSSMADLVLNKIQRANDLLQHPKDDLPPVSLSVGVAFSDRKNPKGDIFKDADTALYQVKESGRNGCRIFE